MKKLFILLVLAVSLVSCKKETELRPSNIIPAQTKLKKILTYRTLDKTEIHGMTTFEYNQDGNLAKETYYFSDTINPLIYSIFEYENGKKAHEYKYNAMGDVYQLSQKYSFLYIDDLLVKKELRRPPEETVSGYTDYQYDYNGNLILESRVQVDPFFRWNTEYEVDSNNLRIKTIRFNEYSNISGYTEHNYLDNLLSYEKVFNSQNELYCEYNYSYNSESNLTEKTKTIQGETKTLESISYLDGFIHEKIIYDWNSNWGYSFRGLQVYEYE